MDRRPPNLVTIEEAARQRPFFTPASLRDKRYHGRPRLSARGEVIPPNGFADVFVVVGRRVLVDLDRLDERVEAGRGEMVAA